MQDLAGRLANRVQLTTDGLKVYLNAVIDAFSDDIDYAVLHKIYGADRPDAARYSPATCIGCEKREVLGNPDAKHVSTSYVEQCESLNEDVDAPIHAADKCLFQELENHAASVAIYFTWYNFGWVHQTLKTTPAMIAGVADHVWSVDEMVELLSKVEPKSTRPAVSN